MQLLLSFIFYYFFHFSNSDVKSQFILFYILTFDQYLSSVECGYAQLVT